VGRGQAVAADHNEGDHLTDLSGPDLIARSLVSRVEATLKTDLQPSLRALDVRDDVARLGDADRDRLLAERRDARVEAFLDERGVRIGRRDDHRRIHAPQRLVHARGGPRLQRTGDLFRASAVRVVDTQLVHVLRFAENLGVERAQTADAEDGDTHRDAFCDGTRRSVRIAPVTPIRGVLFDWGDTLFSPPDAGSVILAAAAERG